nr:serine hydrolase [Microbulbifer elongatus]
MRGCRKILDTNPESLVKYPPSSSTSPVTAKSAIGVIIRDKKARLIYEKNSEHLIYPASITKLLTALTAIEIIVKNNISPITSVEVAESDDIEGSGRNLKPGDRLSFLDCIANLLISSSNMSANVIAREMGGILVARGRDSKSAPIDCFIHEMNRVARELRMKNAYFINAHGLANKAQRCSARDLSLLVRKCSENTIIRGLWNKLRYTIPVHGENAREIPIKSSFIFSTLSEVPEINIPQFRGGKSGALWPSYFNLAAVSALNPGTTLISVTAGSPSPKERYNDYLSMVRLGQELTASEQTTPSS